MPASASLFRSKASIQTPINTEVPVPLYAVLLWHANDGSWDATSRENGSFDGAFTPQYYRRLDSISRFPTYPDASQVSYPLIRCVADDADWKNLTGKLHSADVNFDSSLATLLETAGGHNPATMLRTKTYVSSGYQNGDVVNTNNLTYRLKKSPHAGHSHFVDNVRKSILSINYGNKDLIGSNLTNPYLSKGIQTLQVDLLIRDPKLSGGTNNVNWLPKNVIVFGTTLPAPYYTRTDTISTTTKSANGRKYLPLLAKHPHVGVEGDDMNEEIMNVFALSSISGEHSHEASPATDLQISNKTNQTGYRYNNAGNHAHVVEYVIETYIKSKFLKAWVTTEDKTPIADGTILLYAIGPGTGYDGPGDDSSLLPPNWHFCDGNNGTPDLRDYYVMANFEDNDHNVVNNENNTATIYSVLALANGQHTHYTTTSTTGLSGTMIDVGGHGEETSLNHTHGPSAAISFKKRSTDTQSVTNIKPGYQFEYTPPTVTMAFIMYNAAIP